MNPPTMSKRTVVSAHTTYSNTPETDQRAEVLHDVKLSDGSLVTVYATDPSTAIKTVTCLLDVMDTPR